MKPIDEAWGWLKKRMNDSVLMLGVLLVLGAVAATNGRETLNSVVEERIKPVKRQVDVVEKKQDRYEEDIHEFSKDVRELYWSQRFGARSDRLERPFVGHDGGEP